jgi:hypothetical protein
MQEMTPQLMRVGVKGGGLGVVVAAVVEEEVREVGIVFNHNVEKTQHESRTF